MLIILKVVGLCDKICLFWCNVVIVIFNLLVFLYFLGVLFFFCFLLYFVKKVKNIKKVFNVIFNYELFSVVKVLERLGREFF